MTMTPADANGRMRAINERVRRTHSGYIILGGGRYGEQKPISLNITPHYSVSAVKELRSIRLEADTFEEIFELAYVEIDKQMPIWRAELTRAMGAIIIAKTDELGQCTEADLRMAGYSTEDIEEYADEAAAHADKMADNGPFTVIKTPGKANSD